MPVGINNHNCNLATNHFYLTQARTTDQQFFSYILPTAFGDPEVRQWDAPLGNASFMRLRHGEGWLVLAATELSHKLSQALLAGFSFGQQASCYNAHCVMAMTEDQYFGHFGKEIGPIPLFGSENKKSSVVMRTPS
ncbi:hypothetical protein JTB14_002366 [Gonioctena quinquepunctata]|nr:hypothetical protein JTB14_002366 [Gonioctena quinquepunctata]